MNNFINHLLSRHMEPGNNIKPRIRSRFEPVTNFPGMYPDATLAGQDFADENRPNLPVQQEKELYNSDSADRSNISKDQTLNSFTGISGGTDTINNKPLISSFP